MRRMQVMCLCVGIVVMMALAQPLLGAEVEKKSPGLPLPLHTIEGVGGVLITQTAYLVNPAAKGDIFGLPSVGATHLRLGHGRRLEALTITETLWDRLELGYGYNYLDLGDLPREIRRATGTRIGDHSVDLHHFNARLLLVKEGDFGYPWLPAITGGFHYKYNSDSDDIDKDLNGGLTNLHIDDNDGIDWTLYATKTITALPRPVIVSVGIRSTQAAQTGLLGATDDRSTVFEGNILALVTDNIGVGGEYRQKPDQYHRLGTLVEREDDWWTLFVCYVFNEHLTATAGYGHFGQLINHQANGVWGLKLKYEF